VPYEVDLATAQALFPEYKIIQALTPSEQKAAFHVEDAEGVPFCLKLIAPTYSPDRLDREISALQSLSHPNVVGLVEYTYSTRQGTRRHYIIEEFVEGEDLQSVLVPGAPWPLARACTFFSLLSDGLQALKNADLVHRDLKPTNIRVRPDGSPVIVDFGLVRHLSLPDLTRTDEGAAIGTPVYFAPEQFTGTKRDIDHRTDLFALGILLYQALVGSHPFMQDGMSYGDLREAVCHSSDFTLQEGFKNLDTSPRLLLGRLLEKERAKRPQSAAQVATMLRRIGVDQ